MNVKAEKKTYNIANLTIGSKIFVVHRQHAFAKKPGGKVNQGRVVAFFNSNGKIKVEFKITGHPVAVNEDYYYVFDNVANAIKSIKS